ncbi:unnamed protein product [Discula destructiva]
MSLNQLSMLLGLPDSDIKQIIEYASTLSKADAADHFKNLLGDSPQAIEFISSFNTRRQDPRPSPAPPARAPVTAPSSSSQPASDTDGPKKRPKQQKNKKPAIHTPAPRRVVDTNPGPGTVYNKKQSDNEYIIGRGGSSASSNSKPPSRTATPKTSTPPPQQQKSNTKPPPSAAGSLVSDLLAPKAKPVSNPTSRSGTPGPSSSKNNAPKAKVSITGGTPMHGASGAVADLDAAIRALEITTNPSLSSSTSDGPSAAAAAAAAQRCNCVATRHPLQTAAPNCLHCGKVICLKEGLGPCTSCGHALLSADDVHALLRELKAERGREKQAADREAHRRPDVATAPRAFTKARTGYEDETEAEARAKEHRDKLLNFQAQNARRTTVRDEAADFDVAGAMAGTGSMWASPEERARELKRQQRLLREMEWNARPEYEKRQQVVSIDLVGGKVVKKFVAKERPRTPDEDDVAASGVLEEANPNRGGGGAFSRNPLLGGLIKPVYDASASADGKGKGVALEGRKDGAKGWRRVQDDLSNNESVILDGGVYGGKDTAPAGSAGDEPGCG